MTYSLHTLQTASPPSPATHKGMGRFANEIALIAGFVLLALWLIAMLTYSPQDAAWSTSGAGLPLANRAGRLGAWVADVSYFLLGFSVWWCLAVGMRVWLALLANRLRGDETVRAVPHRLVFWLGLALLLYASTSLEWTRLYSLEARLPGGHSGGVLGYVVGPLSVKWLGFAGSGLVAIALGLVGTSLVFGFSWMQVAERMGAWVDAQVQSRRKQRERAQDREMGQQAMREREEILFEEREETYEHHPQPVVIVEPVVMEPPRSERVAKERQKPLFTEMPDTKLPQVDLLDGALARQETVAPETLEMTSRMIEKKLKDFGVEVRVVLAQPGPVITRYEIEPATGVKGSQIVGLAKDLARSLSLVSIRVVETIPGKTTMALELPNAKRQSIRLSEILGSQVYNDSKSMLTMGLGKDIVGNPIVADLAKMPHVLVAGTTGSGKSVGINAMILSLLYKAEASDVRFLMIDPKML
ncbi:MAG TPA: DNA translocase FtsK 4TM domain-containing protein, partial [Rhodoferax sp.]|nr:DNA translocase FtsK 4TM domain-containing protein [Rhodoferax sp.]